MESRTCLSFFFVVFMSFLLSSQAYVFSVGGSDGWVVKPSEGYGPWAARNRFLINDTLVFKYKNGTDSVLVVNKQDYDACNVSNPILRLEGGDSSYIFDRSGPFYFITGNQSNCQSDQKLVTVVLSLRTTTPPTAPPPSTAPGATPSTSPPGTSPSTSPPGTTPTSSPPGTTPSTSPPGTSIPPSGADSPGERGGNTPGGAGGDTAPSPSSSPSLSSPKGFALGLSLLVTLAFGRSIGSY